MRVLVVIAARNRGEGWAMLCNIFEELPSRPKHIMVILGDALHEETTQEGTVGTN